MRFTPLFAATTLGGQVGMVIEAAHNSPWWVMAWGMSTVVSAFMLGWVTRIEEAAGECRSQAAKYNIESGRWEKAAAFECARRVSKLLDDTP